jgi:hypothetical protein
MDDQVLGRLLRKWTIMPTGHTSPEQAARKLRHSSIIEHFLNMSRQTARKRLRMRPARSFTHLSGRSQSF